MNVEEVAVCSGLGKKNGLGTLGVKNNYVLLILI